VSPESVDDYLLNWRFEQKMPQKAKKRPILTDFSLPDPSHGDQD
jgi:hypothetical protein